MSARLFPLVAVLTLAACASPPSAPASRVADDRRAAAHERLAAAEHAAATAQKLLDAGRADVAATDLRDAQAAVLEARMELAGLDGNRAAQRAGLEQLVDLHAAFMSRRQQLAAAGRATQADVDAAELSLLAARQRLIDFDRPAVRSGQAER